VHQDDALTVPFQLTHHRLNHLFRLVHLEVACLRAPTISPGYTPERLRHCVESFPRVS
jgi:hypothetical protein